MTAFDTINRLDDCLPVCPADLARLEIAEQDASNRWYHIERQVDSWQADACIACDDGTGTVVCDDCAEEPA